MPSFVFLRRPAIFAAMLLPLLASARLSAHGQGSKASLAAPKAPVATTAAAPISSPIEGTGEQMRAITAICDMWEARRLAEEKKGGKKVDPKAPQDSSDIRDYDFSVTQEATVYKVTLTPRKPAVLKFTSPRGTHVMNNSSTFFYDVRRSDFKIVAMSMIL